MKNLNFAPLLLSIVLLTACATSTLQEQNPIAEWSPSANYDERRPRLIVLHATEMNSNAGALAVLKSSNAGGRVSAHYLIAEDGRIQQLVTDGARAWHAGAGRWHGINDINSVSLGIELDNDGNEPFNHRQIDALIILLTDLCKRHNILRSAIIGHSDIAPTRKQDPGIRFPWQQLADAGFGVWYSENLIDPPPEFDPVLALSAFGYDTRDLPAAIRAFHRHFRAMESDTLDAFDRKILYQLIQNDTTR
jgi:N-acetylmuramoyl-L-alanine amidase